MSEAAKNLAVEDVLTSIRRLLAQDGPTGAEGPGAEGQMYLEHTLAALEAAMASRITPPAAALDADERPADLPPADPQDDAPANDFQLTEAAVVEAPESAAADALSTPDVTPNAVMEEVEEAPFIAVDMPDEPAAPSFSFRHTAEIRRLQLVTPEAEEPRREAEEPAGGPAVVDMEFVAPLEVESELPSLVEALAEEPVAAEVTVLEPVAEVAPVPVAPMNIAPMNVAPEPPRLRMAPPAQDEPRSLFHEPDELPIDREMLRALIGEVLREELQGTLGERMTRNVRKLVRAEIRRALAEGAAG